MIYMTPTKQQAYEVYYLDESGNKRCFCTYAKDTLTCQLSAAELLQPGYRIIRIMPVPDFDW